MSKELALWFIPLLLTVIAYLVKKGIDHITGAIKSQSERQEQFNAVINELKIAIKLLAGETQSRCQMHEERFGRIYGNIATLDNTVDCHANTLTTHEIRITKLEQHEEKDY